MTFSACVRVFCTFINNAVEGAFRMFMLRSGFVWAASTPWGIPKNEPLSDKIKAGSAEILAFKTPQIKAA